MEIFEIVALTLLGLTTLYYFFFLTRVQMGITKSLFDRTDVLRFPFISVVIAARNEEHTIESCLHAVLAQQYPTDRFEVLVVDDHSNDNTSAIVQRLQSHYQNLKLISSKTTKNGKIAALQLGVEEAKGELIITTDADCVVSPQWFLSILSHYDDSTAMIAGPVLIQEEKSSFLAHFDQLELLGLVTVAAGLIGSGRPIICNGANLAYRRQAFFLVGGFKNATSDNDDEYLMNKFVHQKIGKIKFVLEPTAVVRTKAVSTFRSFFHQRLRWAGKKGHYLDFSIFLELTILYFFFFSLLLNLFFGISYNTMFLLPVGLAWGGKVLLDYFTLRLGANLWNERIPLGIFFIAELFHVPYIFITALCAQFLSLHWKDRKLSV